MKRIFKFFRSFHFILLVLVVLLALAVYFYGQHIPVFGEYHSTILKAIIVLYVTYYAACFVFWMARKWRARSNKKPDNPEDEMLHEYLLQVEKFIWQSVSELGIRRSIKKMPMHWVVGRQGAGKKTFIKNSSSDQEKVKSLVLSLDNLVTSWHVLEKGIFFEFNLDQSNAPKNQLLGKLINRITKRNWPFLHPFVHAFRRPVRLGRMSDFILLLSSDDLAFLSQQQLYEQSKFFTGLMQTCAMASGYMYPAFLVLSKIDLIHGCKAYFDCIDSKNEQGYWGAVSAGKYWYKLPQGDLNKQLRQRLDLAYKQVMNDVVPVAQKTSEKLSWNAFPFHLQQLNRQLDQFMDTASGELQQLLAHPGFSAVFMIAAEKGREELIYCPVNKNVFFKRSTPVEWNKERSVSLMLDGLHGLLSRGVGNAPVPSLQRARNNFRKSILATLVLMVVTVSTIGIGYSNWRANKQLINEFHQTIHQIHDEYDSENINPANFMLLLNTAISQFELLQNRYSYLALLGIDIHLMNAGTTAGIENFLLGAMKDELDIASGRAVVAALQTYGQEWEGLSEQQKSQQRDDYYRLLETYLMITRFPEKMQPQDVAEVMAPVWHEYRLQRQPTRMDAQILNAVQKVLAYFYRYGFDTEQAERWTINSYDEHLVANARSNLAIEATAEAIYQLLVDKNQQNFESVKLSDVIPVSYPYILRNDYQFNAMYTRDNWETYIANEIRATVQRVSMDDWVLAEQTERVEVAPSSHLESRVMSLYFEDYRRHWEAYLQAFYMPQYQSLDEIHHNLKLLGGERSPLRPLAAHLQHQAGVYQALNQLNTPLSGQIQGRFSSLQAFADFFHAEDGAAFNLYLEDINRLAAEIESMLAAARVSNEALQYASALLTDQGNNYQLYTYNMNVNRVRLGHEPKAGELLQHLLLLPAKASWRTILNTARDELQAEWERNVYDYYMAHIRGYFPFDLSREDVSLSAFRQFFSGEQGVLWRFYRSKSEPFVVLHTNTTEVRTWLGMGLEFNDAYLTALKNGQHITRALLTQSNGEAGFRYALLPEPVPSVSESRFSQDESLLVYRNEPQQWRDFLWSAGRQNSVARIQLRVVGQPLPLTTQAEGAWSLLRLLYSAESRRISNTEYELVWQLPDGGTRNIRATYRFRSDQARLFLNKQLFTGYRLPRQIF